MMPVTAGFAALLTSSTPAAGTVVVPTPRFPDASSVIRVAREVELIGVVENAMEVPC